MYKANVEGTRELLRLAREAGVPRVVHTSSVATMGFKTDSTIVDEETPVSEADMIGHYKRSKWLAEQEAIAASRAGAGCDDSEPDDADWSPHDTKPTPTGRILVDFLNKNFPAYVHTGLNLVGGRAEVARASGGGRARQTRRAVRILGGENLTLEADSRPAGGDYGFAISEAQGAACEWRWRLRSSTRNITGKLRGKEPRATVEAVRMGKRMSVCDLGEGGAGSGVCGEAGGPEAMRSAVEWFVANGYAAEASVPHPLVTAVTTRVAIIAALPREVAGLVRGWEAHRELVNDGIFTRGAVRRQWL